MKINIGCAFGRNVKHVVECWFMFRDLIDGCNVLIVDSGDFNVWFKIGEIFEKIAKNDRHCLACSRHGSLQDGGVDESVNVGLRMPFRCSQSGRGLEGCHGQRYFSLLVVHPVPDYTAEIFLCFSTGATYVVLRHNSVELCRFVV